MLGVHCDLAEEVEVLDVGLGVDLGDLKVVDTSGHLSELLHHLHSLSIREHSAGIEHVLELVGQASELEQGLLGTGLTLKDTANHYLHAKSDGGFLLGVAHFNRAGQLDHHLQQPRLYQHTH